MNPKVSYLPYLPNERFIVDNMYILLDEPLGTLKTLNNVSISTLSKQNNSLSPGALSDTQVKTTINASK